jgi:hypothetical protein
MYFSEQKGVLAMIRGGAICILSIIALAGSAGCTAHPRLKLTEVAGGTVELYLDRQDQFNLSRLSLKVETATGYSNSFNLLGTMPGRSYLVIFEEVGYTGQPASATYVDPFSSIQCSGIKVAENFFGWNLGGTSFAFRLSGDSGRGPGGIPGLFFSRWEVDDVVTFGTRPRPAVGGNFTEDTTAPISLPVPPGTVSRTWGPNGPIDNDLESDWRNAFPTFCAQTQ